MQFLTNRTDEFSHKMGFLSFSTDKDTIFDEQGGSDNYYRVAFANFTKDMYNTTAELET